MQTDPIYLSDPYAQEMDAQILTVEPETPGRWRLLLDQTVFYPMGGGQPTDQGVLSWQEGHASVKVYQVMLKEGEIWHYIEMAQPPAVGTTVHGKLDWERRFQNMRVHTGGHLVDFALFLLGFVPNNLKPLKGDHGKKPFVMYQGTAGGVLTADTLEQKANEIIRQDLSLKWEFVGLEALQSDAIYLQPGLPVNKPLRKLTLQGVGSVADGGTILSHTAAVGALEVLGIEEKDGTTKVSYQVSNAL